MLVCIGIDIMSGQIRYDTMHHNERLVVCTDNHNEGLVECTDSIVWIDSRGIISYHHTRVEPSY